MTWVSAQLASGRGKGPYESYAHRLYAEGLEAIKARAAAAEAAAARREEAELDGATWTPSIGRSNSKTSSAAAAAAAAASGTTTNNKNNAWERLAATPLRRASERDRLERLRDERLEAETAECTFAPEVSRGTRKIIAAREEARNTTRSKNGEGGQSSSNDRNRSTALYESLYHDAERRRQRAAREEEAVYGPSSSSSKKKAAPGDKGKNDPPAVALRLLARRARVDARLAAERDAAERRPVDAQTGRPLFVPSVGRAPLDIPTFSSRSMTTSTSASSSSTSRQRVRPSNTSVGDFLFQQRLEMDARRREAVARADAAMAAASSARAIPKSNEMMARLRGRRFLQIHRYLSSGLEKRKDAASSVATTPRGEGGQASRAAVVVPLDALPPHALAAAAADAALLASMDPEVAADVAAAARLAEAAGVVVSSSSPSRSANPQPPALLDAAAFAALMEAVVRRSGVPRAYLQPGGGWRCSSSSSGGNAAAAASCCDGKGSNHSHVLASRHHARCGGHEAETFAPAILPESVALAEAAGRRPAGVDVVRAMEADAAAAEAHLERARERFERQDLSECTFRPRLVAQERPVRGARDPGADAAAAARAKTQVGKGMVLPVAEVAVPVRARRFLDEEEEGGEEVDDDDDDDEGRKGGKALRIPALPFLQKNGHFRPRSPGVGRYEQLDYELRAAIEEEERREMEEEEEGEKEGEESGRKPDATSSGRIVFDISVSASATGAVVASSSEGPSKPLPESTLETLQRALAGAEDEGGIEQQEMPPRSKSRGGGWQMAI